jgi:arylsulfatase A-like enzyme
MRILYIDFDSCRPDHLGCYGYHRDTSPAIDSIARDGTRFDQFYTPDAPCMPSRTAFYSGRFGIQTGVVGHGNSAAEPRRERTLRRFGDRFETAGLARQFQLLNLHTAMISTFGQRHSAHWFYAGFNEIHNTGQAGMESAHEVWPVLDRWLNTNAARDNWYLHVNFWDPHTPYRVPLNFGDPFANAPLPKHLDDDELIARHVRKTGPHSAMDLYMYTDASPDVKRYGRGAATIENRTDMKRWIDGYDTGIRYADHYVGRAIDFLKSAGLYEQTAIIVSGDHGENQGELGLYGEHATADVGTCRIPMIVKWPGLPKGHVDDRLHYNVDLAPTLMDLLGGEKPALWDGQSFASTLTDGRANGRDDLVISQCAHVCQRSVRWDKWLYMRTYHDGFHLFPQEMLFDLQSDPYEQNDIALKHPELCREGAWRLSRWHDVQMNKLALTGPGDMTDPLWTVIQEGGPAHALHAGPESPLPRYLKRLEATGRADGAAALREKYKAFL